MVLSHLRPAGAIYFSRLGRGDLYSYVLAIVLDAAEALPFRHRRRRQYRRRDQYVVPVRRIWSTSRASCRRADLPLSSRLGRPNFPLVCSESQASKSHGVHRPPPCPGGGSTTCTSSNMLALPVRRACQTWSELEVSAAQAPCSSYDRTIVLT